MTIPINGGPIQRPALLIERTDGRLSLDKRAEEVELQVQGQRLELEQTPRQVDMTVNYPRVNIDTTQSRIELGQHTMESFGRESAEKGSETAQEYIARKAAQGDELARIEEGGDPLIRQALDEVTPQKELNIRMAPKTPPQIEVSPGDVRLDLSPPGEVRVATLDDVKRLYFDKDQVEATVMTKPNLDIRLS